jgi:hypothetical protein
LNNEYCIEFAIPYVARLQYMHHHHTL